MRTTLSFALLAAMAFSTTAVGQETAEQIAAVTLEAPQTLAEGVSSAIDVEEPAPSDADIDTARIEIAAATEDATVAGDVATEANTDTQYAEQAIWYPAQDAGQGCGCQSTMIAPVAYQEPALVGVVEGATEVAVEGAMGVQPIADAMSVVESPITETGPVYSDAGGITEGGNVMAGGETIVLGGETMAAAAPSCGCGGASTPTAMPTEGLISTSPAGYQSAPVTYASAAPAAAPCCTPARRGFFRTLFGR